MSEFLMRGWNVAIPEVDIGDDIFVVQDNDGTLRRVQVKTSTSTPKKEGYSGQFSISLKNLKKVTNILVHYIFLVRHNDAWSLPVIIRQDYLLDFFANHNEYNNKDAATIYINYCKGNITCLGQDLKKYEKDYSDFPKLEH